MSVPRALPARPVIRSPAPAVGRARPVARSWRRAVWVAHSWLGLASAVFLTLISLTGAFLVFNSEIERLVQPALFATSPGPALPLDTVVARVTRAHPAPAVAAWDLPQRPGDVHRVILGEGAARRWLLVDPATARVTGELGAPGTLLNQVRVFHWSFLVPGRPGGLVAAVCGLLLAASSVTGLVVLRRVWAPFTRPVRWRAGVRQLAGDGHRLVGVSALALNLTWGLTGAWLNRTFLVGYTDDGPTAAVASRFRAPGGFVQQAEAGIPGFRSLGVEWPSGTSDTLTVYGRTPDTPWYLTGSEASRAEFSVRTGHVLAFHDGRPATAAEWADAVGATLHYGRFAGWPVKALYVLLGLSPAALALSGAVVWWRRVRGRPRMARGGLATR